MITKWQKGVLMEHATPQKSNQRIGQLEEERGYKREERGYKRGERINEKRGSRNIERKTRRKKVRGTFQESSTLFYSCNSLWSTILFSCQQQLSSFVLNHLSDSPIMDFRLVFFINQLCRSRTILVLFGFCVLEPPQR